MKKIVILKYLVFLIPALLIGCCKYGCHVLKVRNVTAQDKYITAYIIEDGQSYYVEDKNKEDQGFSDLTAYRRAELILTDQESWMLERKPNEKNLKVYFYDSAKEAKNKSLVNSIVKTYSFEELEDQNWVITFE